MNELEKQGDGGFFEENLRQILSYEPINGGGNPPAPAPNRSARHASAGPTRRYQAAADKFQADQKTIFWLGFLRPAAVVALAALMAAFVYRIVNFTN